MGWFFGKKDKEFLPLYDVGFRFHLTTFLVFMMVSSLWFILQTGNVVSLSLPAISWGIGLLIHFILYLIAQKNTIGGIKKEQIFD